MNEIAHRTPDHDFAWEDVAKALFVARGIDSGLWRLGVRLQFGGVTNQWQSGPEDAPRALPTALVGVDGVALWSVDGPGPMVFEAGPDSPKKSTVKPRRRKTVAP